MLSRVDSPLIGKRDRKPIGTLTIVREAVSTWQRCAAVGVCVPRAKYSGLIPD